MNKIVATIVGLVIALTISVFTAPTMAREEALRVIDHEGKTYIISENCKPSVKKCLNSAKNTQKSSMEPGDELGGG